MSQATQNLDNLTELQPFLRAMSVLVKKDGGGILHNPEYPENPYLLIEKAYNFHSQHPEIPPPSVGGRKVTFTFSTQMEEKTVFKPGEIRDRLKGSLASLANVIGESYPLSSLVGDLQRLTKQLETATPGQVSKSLRHFMSLAPLLYDTEGALKIKTNPALSLKSWGESRFATELKIIETPTGYDSQYKDLLVNHIFPLIEGAMPNQKEIYSTAHDYIYDLLEKDHRVEYVPSKKSVTRQAELEQVPLWVALFRGNLEAVRDCSVTHGAGLALVGDTWFYRRGEETLGYVLVVPVKRHGEITPYIVTPNGKNFSGFDIEGIARAIQSIYKSKSVIFPDFGLSENNGLVNFVDVKSGILKLTDHGQGVAGLQLPESWKLVREEYHGFSHNLTQGISVQLPFVPIKETPTDTYDFSDPKLLAQLSEFERHYLATLCLLNHPEAEAFQQQLTEALLLAPEKLKVLLPLLETRGLSELEILSIKKKFGKSGLTGALHSQSLVSLAETLSNMPRLVELWDLSKSQENFSLSELKELIFHTHKKLWRGYAQLPLLVHAAQIETRTQELRSAYTALANALTSRFLRNAFLGEILKCFESKTCTDQQKIQALDIMAGLLSKETGKTEYTERAHALIHLALESEEPYVRYEALKGVARLGELEDVVSSLSPRALESILRDSLFSEFHERAIRQLLVINPKDEEIKKEMISVLVQKGLISEDADIQRRVQEKLLALGSPIAVSGEQLGIAENLLRGIKEDTESIRTQGPLQEIENFLLGREFLKGYSVEELLETFQRPNDDSRCRTGVNWAMSHLALQALIEQGSVYPRLVPLLIEYQETGIYTKSVLTDALAQVGSCSKELIPGLIQLLDKDGPCFTLVLNVLEKAGPVAKEAVPSLVQKLNLRDEAKRDLLIKTLFAIDPEYQEIVPALVYASVVSKDRRAENLLEEIYRGPEAKKAVFALIRFFGAAFLNQFPDNIQNSLLSEAVKGLTQIGYKHKLTEVLPQLMGGLRDILQGLLPYDPSLSTDALVHLIRCNTPDLEAPVQLHQYLADLLNDERTPEHVCWFAVCNLEYSKSLSVAQRLIQFLQKTQCLNDEGLRERVLKILSTFTGSRTYPQELPTLMLQFLKSGSSEEKKIAFSWLGNLEGDNVTIPVAALVSLLQTVSDDWEKGGIIIRVLGKMGEKAAPATQSLRELIEQGGVNSINALCSLSTIAPDPEILVPSATSLLSRGSWAALPIILKYAGSDQALQVLPDLIAHLQEILKSWKNVPEELIQVFGKMGTKAQEALPALIEAFSRTSKEKAQEINNVISLVAPQKTLEQLLLENLENKTASVRAAAAKLLGEPPLTKNNNSSIEAALLKALSDPETEVRNNARESLLGTKPVSEQTALACIQDLKNDDEKVRHSAAQALGKIEIRSEWTLFLVETLCKIQDRNVVYAIVEQAQRLIPCPSIDISALLLGLSCSHDPSFVAPLLDRVIPKDEKSIGALCQALSNKNGTIRALAAVALAEKGEAARFAVPALTQALVDGKTDKESLDKKYIFKALVGLERCPSEIVPEVIEALSSNNPSLREAAVQVLTFSVPTSLVIGALAELLAGRDGWGWRLQDIERLALQTIKSQTSLDKNTLLLLSKALSETRFSETQKEVLSLLGRQGPQAKETFPELIRFYDTTNPEMKEFLRKEVQNIFPTEELQLEAFNTLLSNDKKATNIYEMVSAVRLLGKMDPKAGSIVVLRLLNVIRDDCAPSLKDTVTSMLPNPDDRMATLLGALSASDLNDNGRRLVVGVLWEELHAGTVNAKTLQRNTQNLLPAIKKALSGNPITQTAALNLVCSLGDGAQAAAPEVLRVLDKGLPLFYYSENVVRLAMQTLVQIDPGLTTVPDNKMLSMLSVYPSETLLKELIKRVPSTSLMSGLLEQIENNVRWQAGDPKNVFLQFAERDPKTATDCLIVALKKENEKPQIVALQLLQAMGSKARTAVEAIHHVLAKNSQEKSPLLEGCKKTLDAIGEPWHRDLACVNVFLKEASDPHHGNFSQGVFTNLFKYPDHLLESLELIHKAGKRTSQENGLKEKLIEIAATHAEPKICGAASRALSSVFPDRDDLMGIFEEGLSSQSSKVRQYALMSLVELDGNRDQAVKKFVECSINTGVDPETELSVVMPNREERLSKIKEGLYEALCHNSPEIRAFALTTLAGKTYYSAEVMSKMLEMLGDPNVNKALTAAFAKVDPTVTDRVVAIEESMHLNPIGFKIVESAVDIISKSNKGSLSEALKVIEICLKMSQRPFNELPVREKEFSPMPNDPEIGISALLC